MGDLATISQIAVSGMKAQSYRLRVVSENMANTDSIAKTPGGEPYRRKVVTFKNELDRNFDANMVQIDKVTEDKSEFGRKYDPNHPGADANGYVLTPNVNPLIEMMDMREAQKTYQANLNVINVSREMMSKTIELLR